MQALFRRTPHSEAHVTPLAPPHYSMLRQLPEGPTRAASGREVWRCDTKRILPAEARPSRALFRERPAERGPGRRRSGDRRRPGRASRHRGAPGASGPFVMVSKRTGGAARLGTRLSTRPEPGAGGVQQTARTPARAGPVNSVRGIPLARDPVPRTANHRRPMNEISPWIVCER